MIKHIYLRCVYWFTSIASHVTVNSPHTSEKKRIGYRRFIFLNKRFRGGIKLISLLCEIISRFHPELRGITEISERRKAEILLRPLLPRMENWRYRALNFNICYISVRRGILVLFYSFRTKIYIGTGMKSFNQQFIFELMRCIGNVFHYGLFTDVFEE